MMQVEFDSDIPARLETDPSFDAGLPQAVVRAFRKRMQFIRAAADERDFYAMKSLHFEKLKGDRATECSMRLNDQWRLILKIKPSKPKNTIVIVGIEDYH